MHRAGMLCAFQISRRASPAAAPRPTPAASGSPAAPGIPPPRRHFVHGKIINIPIIIPGKSRAAGCSGIPRRAPHFPLSHTRSLARCINIHGKINLRLKISSEIASPTQRLGPGAQPGRRWKCHVQPKYIEWGKSPVSNCYMISLIPPS